jgi:arylsulfatase A-like enzyme
MNDSPSDPLECPSKTIDCQLNRRVRANTWIPVCSIYFLLIAIVCISDVATPRLVSAEPISRPNILFIFADDQRWNTIHAFGNEEIQTPNLDALAESGFHFTNAYCMGSMTPAVCVPSRTMLMTGRSVWRLPQVKGLKAPADVVLLPRVLNQAGYVTFHCGKESNSCRYGNAEFAVNIETKKKGPDDMREHGDQFVRFLATHDRRKPFFAYIAPPVPHDPRVAPDRFVKMYDPNKLTLPRNFMPEHPFDNGELKVRDELLAAHPRTPEAMRQHLADYYASISDLDDQVGRMLDAVRQKGYVENTIVIFSSDQGLAVGGYHGLMGKQNLYEEFKSPLIIAGPGIPHGESAALVYLYDLFPTICDLAGASTPSVVEGKSLMPIITGKSSDFREYLFTAYRECQRMVRDRQWKLIEYAVGDQRYSQLFDLSKDPDEMQNLIDQSDNAVVLTRLREQLQHLGTEFGDPVQAFYSPAFTNPKQKP